jgi:hypothetical protein
MLSVPQIIQIAKISQYLAVADIAKGTIFSPVVKAAPFTPQIIYMERKALEYQYDNNPSDSSLIKVGNYVYALCGKYAVQAQNIEGNGGIVANIDPLPVLPMPLDFIVSSLSIIPEFTSSITLTGLIGCNIEFTRGGIVQTTTDPGGGATYYNWNRTTGLFELFGDDAQPGEQFRIVPYF